jgi:hypothetical protein
MHKVIHALAAIATVGLSGCFVSDKPFITPANADYPFGEVTHFLNFDGPNSNSVVTSESDLILKDAYYYVSDNYVLLFKALDAGFYVMQLSRPPESSGSFYSLMRIDGKIRYNYNNQCSEHTAEMFAATGAIERVVLFGRDRVSPRSRDRHCYVRDLVGLADIFSSLKREEPWSKAVAQ